MEIIILIILAYMMFKIFMLNKRTSKSKKLIHVVNSIGDEEEFFENVNNFEKEMENDAEFLNKGRVIHLWGMAFHNRYEEFDKVLEEIDIDKMIDHKKDSISIQENEDAFFYMYLGIPNILEKNNHSEYRKKVNQKMQDFSEILYDQLVKVLADAINLYYENQGDKGLSFYEKFLNGEYGDYKYSKSLIGLYKSIANAQAAKIYKDNENQEKYDECIPMLQNFKKSGIGERWMQQLGLEVEDKEDEETYEVNEEEEEK